VESEGASEEALARDVEAAQAGDVRAFERLYRAHAGRVYALCLRISADPARAELLTQDAFVRAWERLGSYRPMANAANAANAKGSFGAWLRQLAVNVVLGDLRSSARRTRRVATTDDDAVLDGTSPPPAHGDRLDLERAIATLPEGARAVFVLHDVEGYGHGEIASLMGIAEGTSKAHLHKAREKLKEALR
jgi:RNA polymerase sigma-70 factor (ECF subfamily)